MSTIERVKKVISNLLEIEEDKIKESSTFVEDLGADSLDTYELLQGLEEEFNITMPEDEAQNFKSVGDVIKFIDSQK